MNQFSENQLQALLMNLFRTNDVYYIIMTPD